MSIKRIGGNAINLSNIKHEVHVVDMIRFYDVNEIKQINISTTLRNMLNIIQHMSHVMYGFQGRVLGV